MEPNSNHDDKNIKTIESNSFNHYDKTYVHNIRNLFLKNPEDFRKTHITHNSFEENSINLDEKYNKTDLNNNKNELISQNFIQNSGNHDLNLSNSSGDFEILSDKNFETKKLKNKNKDIIIIFIIIFAVPVTIIFISAYNMLKKKKKNKNNLKNEKFSIIINV